GAGHFQLAPTAAARITRSYLGDTNVLQTRFSGRDFQLTVTDAMTALSEEDKRHHLVGEHELIRLARCEKGECEVELVFHACPHFGRCVPTVRERGPLGVAVSTRAGEYVLRAEAPLHARPDGAFVTW